MASSSKGRASSRKQTSAGKARVISTKRKEALPRTGGVSAGRRKPVVLPPIDALTEPLATAVAAPNKKKAHSLHEKDTTAGRKKPTRAAGRARAKVDQPGRVDETELEVEASAIVEELPVEAVTAPRVPIEPPPLPQETRAAPLARTIAERPAPAASPAPAVPAPHHERRSLMPAISRLLSKLYGWTGVSGTK